VRPSSRSAVSLFHTHTHTHTHTLSISASHRHTHTHTLSVSGLFYKHHLEHLRSEEHTSELQSHLNLVCRLLLETENERTRTRARVCVYCTLPLARESHAHG